MRRGHEPGGLPDDNDDAVKYVVRIPDVAKQAESQQHESHLQNKHAREDDVADLKHIRQLLWLEKIKSRLGIKVRKNHQDRKSDFIFPL